MKDVHPATSSGAPWEQPGWYDAMLSWSREQLGLRSISLARQPVLVKARTWACVYLLPTSAGSVYFKAVNWRFQHEIALTETLFRVAPAASTAVLAADRSLGWMLLGDAGSMLRGLVTTAADLHHWETVLPMYAQLQIDAASRADELVLLGVPDRRLRHLPRLYPMILDRSLLRLGEGSGVTENELERLAALQPTVEALCAELAAVGLPETAQHDDLHDNNVFVLDGQYRVCDWGDACVSHPFFTLLVTLNSVSDRLGLPATSPEIARLRDAYIEPWTAFAPRRELLGALPAALRLAMLSRALTWRMVLLEATPEAAAELGNGMAAWARELLESV